MKKVFSFLKNHPLFVLGCLVSVIALFLDSESGLTLAMATVTTVDPGSPTASQGQAGLNTQLPGEATTVSNVKEASDIIEPDIDEEITKIASDESIIDTIKRRVRRQVRVTGYEVKHYLIDEKPATITVKTKVEGGNKNAIIAFEEAGAAEQIDAYYTAVALGVKGYKEDGVTQSDADLSLMCIGKDASTGNPIFMPVNGTKASAEQPYSNMPAIPAGTVFALCASAAYETQKFIAPSTVVPTPEVMYLQKQLCNRIVSDYFEAQKKKVPFKDSIIAEAILRQFRLESCRTAWIGSKGKIKVQALDPSLGQQFAYFSEGLIWQFKRPYDLELNKDGKFTFDEIIDLAKYKFTGFASSKKAAFLLGKELLATIQKMDVTKHKDISMSEGKVWGIECTKLHTVFGDIDLIHDPTLDKLGYEWCGGLIDEEGLVRYYMKNEDSKTEDVVGEEAKRQVVMTIDCLCLKGYSHVWVNGNALKPTE